MNEHEYRHPMSKIRSLLALAGTLTLLSGVSSAQDRTISSLMLGANQPFNMAGLYYGTLPASHPESRRGDFRKALLESGIKAIRFPGGTDANLFLLDADAPMRDVLGLRFIPEGHKNVWTSPWSFLDFCREARIEPIYQLNTVLYTDGTRVYSLADTREKKVWGVPGVALDPSKREPAARAVESLVRQVAERGFLVRHWEMGNEEYGHPVLDATDYADIATRFARAVRRADPKARVWITLGDNALGKPESDGSRWAETLLSRLAQTELSKDPQVGFTLHYSWKAIVEAAAQRVARHGFTPRFAVTEYHLAGNGPYWDLSPRFGYALELAKYLIAMAPDPRIDILCIHDLVSQNFGIIHYNQKSYGFPDMRTWDPSLGYQLMPSACVMGLFANLIGGTCLIEAPPASDRLVVVKGPERHILAVNTATTPLSVRWNRRVVGPQTQRYELTILLPKPEKDVDPLRVDQVVRRQHTGHIPPEGLNLDLPDRCIAYARCLQ